MDKIALKKKKRKRGHGMTRDTHSRPRGYGLALCVLAPLPSLSARVSIQPLSG